jgi:ribosome maturation factor RimP
VGASPLFCWLRKSVRRVSWESRRYWLAVGFQVSIDVDKIREAAERVARSVGVEVVDVEWKVGKQRLLRIYIDRPPSPEQRIGSGVSHKDCEALSEQLSVILDVEELVPGPGYVLEVSSPGLDRKLVKLADYERFTGRLARIWLSDPVENSKYFEGRLAGCADGVIQLSVRNHAVALPFANIRKAHLVVEF